MAATARTTILLDADLLERLDRHARRERTTKTTILTAALATPVGLGFQPQTEAQLVGALAEALTRHGRVINLYLMTPEDRRYTESLLDEINRLRFTEPLAVGAALAVHQVRLVTSTGVSAKGL